MQQNLRRTKNANHQRRHYGFTIVELLVVLVLTSIVVGITYQFFIKQSRVFEQGDVEANLQIQAKNSLENLKQEFRQGGKDPCNRKYDQTSTQMYPYFAVTPWGSPNINILSNIAISNPFQVAAVHYDTTTGTPGNCVGDGPTITNQASDAQPTHYRPTRAYAYFVNDPVAYAPPPSASLGFVPTCPSMIPPNNSVGDSVRSLIKVPILYSPDLSASTAIALDCANAQVVVSNVECFYVEYLFPLPTDGSYANCNALDNSAPEVTVAGGNDAVCKLTGQPGITTGFSHTSLGLVESIRLTLVLRSTQPQQGFVNSSPATMCNQDAFYPSGLNLAGTSYRTVQLQTTFKLDNLQ